MQTGSETDGKIMVVKNWHVVLILLSWLVVAVLSYAYLRADTNDNTRRIHEMEEKHVRKEQFNELREDIIRRLDRIESKMDRQTARESR